MTPGTLIRKLLTSGAACSLGLVASLSVAQYRGDIKVEAVFAPVTVRTSSGRVVSKVPQNKFHLYIDGIEFPLHDVSPEYDLPLSLGFVLDTSGSMTGRKLEGCTSLINSFLAQRRSDDEISLWTFGNNRVLERFPFGMAWFLLPRVLESIKPWSTTALYDMVLRIPEVMERAEHPRRIAILLTDGVDTASAVHHQEATDIAQRLQTPIYVLGVEPPPPEPGSHGPSYEQVLQLIAEQSGGRYQRIPTAEEMPRVVQDLLEELSSRYIVSFTTSGLGVRKWRSLSVTVDGFDAVTRKGYLGTLP